MRPTAVVLSVNLMQRLEMDVGIQKSKEEGAQAHVLEGHLCLADPNGLWSPHQKIQQPLAQGGVET